MYDEGLARDLRTRFAIIDAFWDSVKGTLKV